MENKETFEDFLKNKHAANYSGTDDAMSDAFDTWLAQLDVEEMLKYGQEYADHDNTLWHIWSVEHTGWWAHNRCGYVTNKKKAGLYSYADALEIVQGANEHRADDKAPYEAMIKAVAIIV